MKTILMMIVAVALIAGCTNTNTPKYVENVDELRNVAAAVGKLKDADKQTIENMKTLIDEDGLSGLSAPQIGINKRIMIVVEEGRQVIMIDPYILESTDEQTVIEESPNVPGIRAVVKRSRLIKMQYRDENGKQKKISAKGGYAARIQHQFDFLQGNLFFDNARSVFSVQK